MKLVVFFFKILANVKNYIDICRAHLMAEGVSGLA